MVSLDPYRSPVPSRPRLSQEVLDSYKRARIAEAVVLVVHEVGIPGLTVSLLVRKAEMARNTFYELFANSEEAVRFAVEMGNARLKKAIDDGVDSGGGWQRRTEAAIERLLDSVEADPELAELCLVHAPGLRGADAPFDPGVVQTLAGILRPGRKEGPKPGPGPRTEEIIAFSILGIIAGRLRRGEAKSLRGVARELAVLAVLPFREAQSGRAEAPEANRHRPGT